MVQLSLFPELVQKLTITVLDDEAIAYAKNYDRSDTPLRREDLAEAYKDGALAILTEIMDIVKKYTQTFEA